MKTWFVPSASRWEHGHWGWRRHLYEVHAEVRSACREFSWWWKTTSTMTPAWSFEKCHICSFMSAEQLWGMAEQSPKGNWPQKCPTLNSLSTSSDPPRQLLLWRCSRGAGSSRPRGATAAQLPERESIGQSEGGILQLGSGKQGRSHSYILIFL